METWYLVGPALLAINIILCTITGWDSGAQEENGVFLNQMGIFISPFQL